MTASGTQSETPPKRRGKAQRSAVTPLDQPGPTATSQPTEEAVVVLGAARDDAAGPRLDKTSAKRANALGRAFLVTLIAGLIAEALLPSWYSMASAVACMVVYFLFGMAQPKSQRNTEQFADSLYYLGFILTLGALFLAMAPGLHSVEITSQTIIEKFGLAILTTFIGMSLRIILLQLRQTATDQEEEARESIARYILVLEQEIETAIDQIKHFRSLATDTAMQSAQHFSERMTELTDAASKAISASNEKLLQNVLKATERIDQSIQEVVSHLNKLDVPTDIFTLRLKESAASLTRDLDTLRGSITNSATAFSGSLSESVAGIQRVKRDLDELEQVIASSNENMTDVAKTSAKRNQEFADAAQKAGESIRLFRAEAASLADVLRELHGTFKDRGASVRSDLDTAAAQVRAATHEINTDAQAFSTRLVESATSIRDALREVRSRD